MPMLVETTIEWMERHGNETVRFGDSVLFPDGAMLSDNGLRYEPPSHPDDLLKVQCQFQRGMLGKLTNEFNLVRSYVSQQNEYHASGFGPPAPAEALADLKKLQQRILDLRPQVYQLELRVRQLTGQSDGPDHGRQAAKQRSMEVAKQLSTLTI